MTPTLPFPFCARPPNQDGQTNVEHPACSSAERSTGMYKALILALLWFAGTCSANAEVWRVREGQCGEWRSWWTVEQDQNGVWTGSIDHEHVGGSCIQGNGTRAQSNVRASIAGENFFATRQFGTGQFCSYFGQMQQDRVRGVELCEGLPTRLAFGLRFPRSADPSQPQQPPTASTQAPAPAPEQDEVSEVPEQGTNDSRGSFFEFRFGPGRQ